MADSCSRGPWESLKFHRKSALLNIWLSLVVTQHCPKIEIFGGCLFAKHLCNANLPLAHLTHIRGGINIPEQFCEFRELARNIPAAQNISFLDCSLSDYTILVQSLAHLRELYVECSLSSDSKLFRSIIAHQNLTRLSLPNIDCESIIALLNNLPSRVEYLSLRLSGVNDLGFVDKLYESMFTVRQLCVTVDSGDIQYVSQGFSGPGLQEVELTLDTPSMYFIFKPAERVLPNVKYLYLGGNIFSFRVSGTLQMHRCIPNVSDLTYCCNVVLYVK
eukprot:504456_1